MKANTETEIIRVDDYIGGFPAAIQVRLQLVRKTILEAAPSAEEVISYRMPAYRQDGMLVYFAAFKNHIGFYPTASGIVHFKEMLHDYKTSKGAIQFPYDKPLPFDLIADMVKFRVKENQEKTALKMSKKKRTS